MGSGVSLRECSVAGKAEGIAAALCGAARDEHRWARREDCGPVGGAEAGERCGGFVCAESGKGGGTGTYGGKNRAELGRGNLREQEEYVVAAGLLLWDAACGWT